MRWAARLLLCGLLARETGWEAGANPQGPAVSQGSATFNSQGSQLTVQTSGNTLINWNSFNIGLGETTTFVEPSASSVVWNHVNGGNPSQILGDLNANGIVILQNQSGIYVGDHATINAAGLLMTTSGSIAPNLANAREWGFDVPPPAASIINYGQIHINSGGSMFLIARDVENHGDITAPQGNIGLYAGKQVLVSERADGRGLTAKVTLPEGSVDNSGRLIADAGTIALQAQTVNVGGLIQANSVREQNGVIELLASDSLNLENSATISARGDTQGSSPGGQVLLKSGNTYSDTASSTIDVSGGAQGGQGGQVEVSAPNLDAIQAKIVAPGGPGSPGGRLSIDPANITLDSTGSSTTSGTINEGDSPATLDLNVASFSTFSQILLQASQNINLNTLWNLTGTVPDSVLTLQAGQNINFGANSGISAGGNWTVNLVAGADFKSPTSVQPGVGSILFGGLTTLQTQPGGSINLFCGKEFSDGSVGVNSSGGGNISVQSLQEIVLGSTWTIADSPASGSLALQAGDSITLSGTAGISAGRNWDLSLVAGAGATSAGPFTSPQDGIYLGGNSVIQTVNGNVSLWAENEVLLGTGNTSGIRTTGAGNIDVTTEVGNINAGSNPNGYTYNRTGAHVSPSLGGISTAAGGNVTLDAVEGNVYSYAPILTTTSDAGSGAFGSQPGNVTVTAGGSVFGHYVEADGIGVIQAGVNAGTETQPFALSLVNGSWTVNAPNGSIFLQEVRNPNGVYDNVPNSPFYYLFNYDPLASVTLNAGNEVDLTGAVLPRTADDVPIIYPPTLSITAGAGGVVMENDVTLFPSANGNLNINTTGPFQGNSHNLVMSDSSAHQWEPGVGTFGPGDHASVPIQLNNPDPVVINVGGDMDNLSIWTPKATQITVGGNMNNSSFEGQNLHASDVTSITVGGEIYNRDQYTYYTLSQGLTANPLNPNDYLDFFEAVYANDTPVFPAGNPGFFYDPSTRQLGFKGVMSQTLEQELLAALSVPVYIQTGILPNGQPQLTQVTFVSPSVIQYFYQSSQDIPNPSQTGYFVGGPGTFNISASSMDLGVTLGVQSTGPRDNGALALFGPGANINIALSGDLDMLSSRIASFFGGNINIYAGGAIDVGSQEILDSSSNPRGIFTTGGGNVTVTAVGNVDVSGSRIAAYDGGNITVESLTGDVNAGNGGEGSLTISGVAVDPVTGQVTTPRVQIAGSGILATTLPDAPISQQVGDITILTPRGNIIASEGGIVQDPLNGNQTPGPTVTLTAGTPDPNNPGAALYPGNIDVSGSGVIGGTVRLSAAGSINGLVVSRQDSFISAQQSFSGTVLSGGTANVSAGTSVSGTIVGINGINASGSAVDASMLSQNVNVGGVKTQGGLASSVAASSTSQSEVQEANAQNRQAETDTASNSGDDDSKRKKGRPLLAKAVGRVTVILPQ